ncbi:hypothetical protein llap_5362 [Limosa lapponica baueri]|uniref:Uncharacterized protein n=1 Tax=Limosa lapponica baueri TaxID=1758121 RepID=A0A2I0UE64_LIMLA|nr:hypothetical protein llap_5362 [Limosa lapponica baueri]
MHQQGQRSKGSRQKNSRMNFGQTSLAHGVNQGSKQLDLISLRECCPWAGAEVSMPYETCSLHEEEKGVSCKDHRIMMTNDPFPTYMIYPDTLSD